MKTYLGDGVYAEIVEGLGLILTTENGIQITNRIVLEPAVYIELVLYVARQRTQRQQKEPHATDTSQ